MSKNIIDIKKERLEKVETELRYLHEDRGNASVDAVGGHTNRINQLEREHEQIEKDIKKLEKASTPEEVKIFFYVIVSNKQKVHDILGKECSCHLADDRYHDSDCNYWKPFKNSPHIEELLSNYKKKYPFTEVYLDGEILDEHRVNIDTYIGQSIAVVDLLSLDNNNKETALKFDTTKAGLLMPVCDTLHQELRELAKSMNLNFKTLNAHINKDNPCTLYFSNVSGIQQFKQSLNNIFANRFPIQNQSTSESNVRGMKFNLL